MLDRYNNTMPLIANEHPKAFSRDGRAHYWLIMDSKDEVILDIQAIQSLTLQTTAPGDIEIYVSNYPYRQVDLTKQNEYQTQPTPPPNVPTEEYITPNPDTVWVSYGTNTTSIISLNTASLAQVKIVAIANTELHAQETNEITETSGLSAGPITPMAVDFTPVVDALNNQDDVEFILIEDNSAPGTYYYSAWVTDTNGSWILQYYDMSGALTAPPTNPIPVQSADYEIITRCFEVQAPFGAYTTGDRLTQVTVLDVLNSSVITTVYYDIIGNTVTPNMADIKPCGSAESDFEVWSVCDLIDVKIDPDFSYRVAGSIITLTDATVYSPGIDSTDTIVWDFGTGEIATGGVTTYDYSALPTGIYIITMRLHTTEGLLFYATADVDWDGTTLNITYNGGISQLYTITAKHCFAHVLVDGTILGYFDTLGNPYTPIGTLSAHCPVPQKIELPYSTKPCCTNNTTTRTYLGEEVLAFNDTTLGSLTPPVNTNHAELQVLGGTLQWGYTPTPQKVLLDLTYLELESIDAINLFRCIGSTGQSGQVIVHYFHVPYTARANA